MLSFAFGPSSVVEIIKIKIKIEKEGKMPPSVEGIH